MTMPSWSNSSAAAITIAALSDARVSGGARFEGPPVIYIIDHADRFIEFAPRTCRLRPNQNVAAAAAMKRAPENPKA